MVSKPQRKTPHPKTATVGADDANAHADVDFFFDKVPVNATAMGHAQRIAQAFGGHVVLLHILVPPHGEIKPVDPVDWDIKRQQTRNWLTGVARGFDLPGHETQSVLLEGQPVGQVMAHMADRKSDIAAAVRASSRDGDRLSDTVCGVLASESAAILMIPSAATPPQTGSYRKILVPLDGSARAESALHMATTLAGAEDAELVLCYVPPEPGVTEFGMIDHEAAKLSSQVIKRNTLAGQTHLTKVKNSLAHLALNVSTLIVTGSDVRRSLIDTVATQAADIMVMATHGQGGHCDVPAGSVARFVFERADIPVLMVRSETHPPEGHASGRVTSRGIRQPVGTDQ